MVAKRRRGGEANDVLKGFREPQIRWKLDGQTPVPCDWREFGEWFETADRVIAQTDVGGFFVSTVFLGIDHSHGVGPPVLFETMVWHDGEVQWRGA